MLVSLRGQRVDCYLILLGGERRERGDESKVFFFPCLSRFKIKSYRFANSVEFESFKMYIINYTDTCRQ